MNDDKFMLVPPNPSFGDNMKKTAPFSEVTVEDIVEKYEAFVKDNTNLEKVRSHGLKWMQPGFIIELFAPDFADKAIIKFDNDPDAYRRYTGLAKILSVGNWGLEGPRKDLVEGDIAYVGDDLHSMVKNERYTQWLQAQPNQVKDKEPPIEFIRKVHRWLDAGMYYLVNRAESTAKTRGIELTLATLGKFKEPLVFRVPPMDILFKVEGNPWA